MPRHQEPKKDVISYEKPWGGANNLIHGYPNEETRLEEKIQSLIYESIVYQGERGELKHLSTHRKRKKNRFCK